MVRAGRGDGGGRVSRRRVGTVDGRHLDGAVPGGEPGGVRRLRPGRPATALPGLVPAFYNSNGFEEGTLLAVNFGDDTDTTGAVYGQLAGAFYGEREIPESWRTKLFLRPVIEGYVERLFRQRPEL